MRLNVIESEAKRLIVELVDADHTVLLLVRDQLEKDSDVKTVTFAIDHPLVGTPKLVVETTRKKPQTAILDAIKELKEELGDVEAQLEKQLK
jgi:DNA-directed RNA polymerase subunit L